MAVSSARAEDPGDEITVSTTSELVAAMSPANAGRTIRIQPGVYCPKAPLTLPEGSEVIGAGIMEYEGSLPAGFRAGTTTEIVPADGRDACLPEVGLFVGNAVFNLTDGSSLRGVKVSIDAARHTFGGNTVVIRAIGGQVTRASMSECDIQARSGTVPYAPSIPGGRALSIMTGDNPPNHDPPGDPRIHVVVSRSIFRGNGPNGAVMVFTSHYESRAQTSVFFHANVFTGFLAALDLVGGISRSFVVLSEEIRTPVTDTLTEVLAIGNLYRGRGIASVGAVGLTAAATAGNADSTFNRLSFTSVGDRIENVGAGINGRAALRRGATHGFLDDNLVELHLVGTELSTVESAADMTMCAVGAPPNVRVDRVGDRNWIHLAATGLEGSGKRDNVFGHSVARCGQVDDLGNDNGVSVKGSLRLWNVQNDDIDPDPAPELFTHDR